MTPVTEISVSIVLQMLSYLSGTGADTKVLLKEAGFSSSITGNPDGRISIQDFLLIQEKALKLTGDDCFGLHLGEYAEAGSWSILGYIVMNCRNVEHALERICRYSEVVGNFIRMSYSKEENSPSINFEIRLPETENLRHCYDAALSSLVTMMRGIAGNELRPKLISLKHGKPDSISEHDRIFNCPVLYDQKAAKIVFDKETASTPVLMNNPDLLTLFEKHAAVLISRLNSENYYTKKVNELIIDSLSDGTLGIENVAGKLAMSIRSLQGKLSDEGVTFRALLENIRRETALSYLDDKHFTVEDITYLVGFSDPSVFRKTFKKWTGITPGRYRKENVFV